jgi:hypothetical protein
MRLVDIIKNNLDLEWNFNLISINNDITIQDILNNPQIKWNYSSINHKATISDILKPIPTGPRGGKLWSWNWSHLSQRIPVDDILAHKELNWNWNWVSQNNSLTFEHVLAHNDISWDWDVICLHCPFRVEMYRCDPYKHWKFCRLSWNRSLHIDDVLANLDLKWDWNGISSNSSVTINHVLKYHTLPWKWDRLSIIIPVCDIFKYPGLPWIWRTVSYNTKITYDDFIRNSHEQLLKAPTRHFYEKLKIEDIKKIFERVIVDNLMGNKHSLVDRIVWTNRHYDLIQYISWFSNISMKDILDNPSIPWNKSYVIMNMFISPKDILKHVDFFGKDLLINLFQHPGIDIDDIEVLKSHLSEDKFKSGMKSFHFVSNNISISDIVRTKHLGWNFSKIPHNLIVVRT